jgi:DNA modification methylase
MSDEKSTQENMDLGTATGGVDSVKKYQFAPIKGYPMLNWRGKRPFTSTQFYPAQLKEVHGEEVDGWRNKIFWGDNLQVMSHLLKEFRGKVDLIYIDPPFDSKADYKKKIKLRGAEAHNDSTNFEEKQYTDIWSNDEYLQFMFERLILMRELLSDSGSAFVHCDPKMSPYLRIIMNEIFGAECFVNEIAWCYKSGGAGSGTFSKKHDNILFYAKKAGEFTFNTIKEKSYVARSGNKAVTYYEDEKGTYTLVNMKDWWDDIGMLTTARGGGRTGYPTEKPPKLSERIISVCSNPGDLVLDAFMGSGVVMGEAWKLSRRFLGIDINRGAMSTTLTRLHGLIEAGKDALTLDSDASPTGFEVLNVNQYEIFRNPVQARELLLEALEVQTLDMSTVFDGEKDGRMVKIMPVNRLATRADLNELIAGFDYKAWERRQGENPNRAVEKITLVCMGHEPDLSAHLILAAKPYKIEVEVVDILRDKADLEFKRDSDAKVVVKDGELVIERFYPMNLLQKLSMQKEAVDDWRELTESILIDWNYDGAVLQPAVVDIPEKKTDLVVGRYKVPADAGTIRVKITDLLSESWEGSVTNG